MPLFPARRGIACLRRQPPPGGGGFLLPISALASLLLLLGSLSLQSLSLQGRLRGEAEQRLQEAEDRLVSAAQMLVATLQLRHACLLPLPLERWPVAGCASAAELEGLARGEVLGSRWRLLSWHPEPPLAAAGVPQQRLQLQLALVPEGSAPAWRAAFLLRLVGQPWRVQDLRPLGLRGSAS